MSRGQSAVEYLMTYGWMLSVVAIVGGAIFATVQDEGLEDDVVELDSTQIQEFMEENTRHDSCDVEIGYDGESADVYCYSSVAEEGNLTYSSGSRFDAELRNGSLVFFSR